MSLRTRALVFATFFGNTIVIGLLLASLTTDYWINSIAKRYNATESNGKINFGLFSGTKQLNLGYGARLHPVNVITFIQTEPKSMNFGLWLGAALGTGFGILSSTIGAIASVLKAASASKKHTTMVLLLIANCSSAISQILAFICWLVQFYQYLIHNVLTVEDRAHNWHTTGLSSLGYSFYLVIISTIIALVNIIILIIAHKREFRERRGFEQPSEEKSQNVIMLY